METVRLKQILNKFKDLRIAVVGDFALDLYFELQTQTAEHSVETGLMVHYGSQIRPSGGGAANVVANLAVYNPRNLQVYGLCGNDLFGRELKHLFHHLGVDASGLLEQHEDFDTYTYVKGQENNEELNRQDFGTHNQPDASLQKKALSLLKDHIQDIDVLILNQQFENSFINGTSAAELNEIISLNKNLFTIADCRNHGVLLKNTVLKLNVHELAAVLNINSVAENDTERCEQLAVKASAEFGSPVLLTRGAEGLSYANIEDVFSENGIFILGDLDITGAGDTCTAHFALAMAAGADAEEACEIANMAASITVQKLNTTGTASIKEIMERNADKSYVYNSKLAETPLQAVYLAKSKIELIHPFGTAKIKHIILDNDGTISTLRRGWEEIMFEVSMGCITGGTLKQTDKKYQDISVKVKNMIEQTTGIQTIVQMHYLKEMVEREGLVPEKEILQPADYKGIYNDALMKNINNRLEEIRKGNLGNDNFLMKGALEFLKKLKASGAALYLASGTDQHDVIHEVKTLGYYEYFGEKIYGSLGNEIGDAKKKVIGRILTDSGSKGESILIIGDGPLEIREGKKAGAFCIGIASNEDENCGVDIEKRRRLIKAGADIIMGDFLEQDLILNQLKF